MLFSEFKEYEQLYLSYLTSKGLADSSINKYLLHITKFFEYMEGKYINPPSVINNINEDHVFSFLEYKESNGSKSSNLIGYHNAIKYFFEFMYYENYIKNLILQKSSGYTENKDEFEYFTKEEMHQIIKSAKQIYKMSNNIVDLRNYVMIVIVAYAGLKLSELANLRDKDIDLQNKSIKITGDRQRIIHISRNLYSILEIYISKKREEYSCEYLFVSRKDNGISKKAIQDVFNKVIKQSGISKEGRSFSPSTVRHTAIKTMIENQMEMPVISNISGLDYGSLYRYIERFTSLAKLKEALYLEDNPLINI